MRTLFVATHFGMGDIILQAGLFKSLAQSTGKKIVFPCLLRYLASAKWLFQDHPNIEPRAVFDDTDRVNEIATLYDEQLYLGRHRTAHGHHDGNLTFDQALYKQAGVPFECRNSMFEVRIPSVNGAPAGKYVFLHEDRKRKLLIDRRKVTTGLPIVEPAWRDNIFEYIEWMKNAAELHLIVSSFMCLAECMSIDTKKYAHLYSRRWEDPRDDIQRTKSQWIEVK